MMTQASGSVGGMTASRNRGGNYMRARAIPTNPNTPQQILVRGLMAQLTSLWVSTLTAAQRAAWELYAANVPLVNSLGDSMTVSGLNMYIRTNVPALQAGLARIDAAPTIFDLGDFTPVTISSFTATNVVIGFETTDAWVSETGAALLTYSGLSVSPTINFFSGPYRSNPAIAGDATTPPTSPASRFSSYPPINGAKMFLRARVIRADGRLSAVQQVSQNISF